MKGITQRSKGILLTVMAIPLLSVFVLTLSCSLDDFILNCCEKPSSTQADHHDYLTSHHVHESDAEESHTHSTAPSAPSEGHHNENDDDCCNDLTTSFFSVFQVQPHVFIADQLVLGDYNPVVAIKKIFVLYEVDQSIIYHGFEPPPKIAPTGWDLRIMHQSFLN